MRIPFEAVFTGILPIIEVNPAFRLSRLRVLKLLAMNIADIPDRLTTISLDNTLNELVCVPAEQPSKLKHVELLLNVKSPLSAVNVSLLVFSSYDVVTLLVVFSIEALSVSLS